MKKFNDKYRIPSARAPWWNYADNGSYFITICCQKYQRFLGECVGGKMHLSRMGEIVEGFWLDIPNHFSFVRLGEFVIMPDHVHGILILDRAVETLQCNVSTNDNFYQKISPKPGSLSTIIRSYKSACTRQLRQQFPHQNFAWQTRFWDHIIRDEDAFHRISHYIKNNPQNWGKEKFYRELGKD